jgi:arsenate reductase
MAVRVLFLCTGNSARSVIAEALLREMGGSDFDVHSAGVSPKGINPYTRRVLADLAIDTSWAESKHMSRFEEERFDYVITVCDDAAEQCPVFSGKAQHIHWSFADPAGVDGTDIEKLAAFQTTLRELKTRLSLFIPAVVKKAATLPRGQS